MTNVISPTAADFNDLADKAQAAYDRMKDDAQCFREWADTWERHPHPSTHGDRAEAYGQGVKARVLLVVEWIEHCASAELAKAIDYRNAAGFQHRLDNITTLPRGA